MADKIKAIKAYTPRIKQEGTADMDRLVEYISKRSGLNGGTIMNVLMELRDSMLFFAMLGEAVKVDGLGTFSPSINLAGEFRLVHRWDKRLKDRLNHMKFEGEIINKDMIGKSADDLVARWNEEHPDDPVK